MDFPSFTYWIKADWEPINKNGLITCYNAVILLSRGYMFALTEPIK